MPTITTEDSESDPHMWEESPGMFDEPNITRDQGRGSSVGSPNLEIGLTSLSSEFAKRVNFLFCKRHARDSCH